MAKTGPLRGMSVIELAGIGPAPMAGMMLADMGAEVIRVERPGSESRWRDVDISLRGKRSVELDIRLAGHRDAFLRLVEKTDALIDPFRPGVCERLGIGPDDCLARNPKLVFARMTGWGQDGPMARAAGHDINYISLTGALNAFRREGQRPLAPLNLVGDMGGGGMLAALGVLAALIEARSTGKGQVVDCAMVDGTVQQLWLMHTMRSAGQWVDAPEANLLDGGAYFYDTYTCSDGKFVAIGAIEPQFHHALMDVLGFEAEEFDQADQAKWPKQKQRIAERIATKTRDEWAHLAKDKDCCLTPVLDFDEAETHEANIARSVFVDVEGHVNPGPAPRFSRTPSHIAHGPRAIGADTREILETLDLSQNEVDEILSARAS